MYVASVRALGLHVLFGSCLDFVLPLLCGAAEAELLEELDLELNLDT